MSHKYIFLFLVGFACLYLCRCAAVNAPPVNDIDYSANSVPMTTEIREAEIFHMKLYEIALTKLEGSDHDGEDQDHLKYSATVSAHSPSPENLPKKLFKANFELFSYFIQGKVVASELARHYQLNHHGRPLSLLQLNQLESIVLHYNSFIRPMIENHRMLEMREMVAVVNAGLVKPISLPRMTEQEMAKLSISIAKKSIISPGTPNNPEIDSHRDLGQNVIFDRLLANPPVNPPEGSGYIAINGKYYLHSQFASLPRSDAIFSEIQHMVIEYVGNIISWFETQGLCDPSTMSTVLTIAFEYSRATGRKQKQKK